MRKTFHSRNREDSLSNKHGINKLKDMFVLFLCHRINPLEK